MAHHFEDIQTSSMESGRFHSLQFSRKLFDKFLYNVLESLRLTLRRWTELKIHVPIMHAVMNPEIDIIYCSVSEP